MRPVTIALLTGLMIVGAYWYVQTRHPEVIPVQLTQWPQRVRQASAAPTPHPPAPPAQPAPPAPEVLASGRIVSAASAPAPTVPPPNYITLYLKNGGVVTGELERDSSEEIVLHWEYGDVAFRHDEIQRIVSGKQDTGANNMTMPWEGASGHWPYQHDVVVKLLTSTVIDAKITDVTPMTVTLSQATSGGGSIEHTIRRADIDQLLFRPIHNERSDQIAANLRTVFPAMSWFDEGLFTIVTDSDAPAVKDYRRTIRELSTDWYLTFYPLLHDRAPAVQQYLVIFDGWDGYMEYALTDGVPGWIAIGYFHPEHQVLYCFNMLGARFSELLYEAYLGQFRDARDRVSAQFKNSRYEETVGGRLSEFLQKLEAAHGVVRQLFGQIGTDVLRHELTHAMFHNWRLQGIALSQMAAPDPEQAQKKREFLKTTDREQKRQLLDELLTRHSAAAPAERQASNAWFVEGLAGYMEPTPVGAINSERLAELQQAHQQQHLLPLEFLNVFRLGSFVGMATPSALEAYAQSWGMCHFLMRRYPDPFLRYLNRLAREQADANQDTLPWLCEVIGKTQRQVEQEFVDYLGQFPHEDPFWLKQMQTLLDLRAELMTLVSRW